MMCFVCNQENGTFKTNSKSFIPDIKFQLIIIYFSVCMVFERAKAVTLYYLFLWKIKCIYQNTLGKYEISFNFVIIWCSFNYFIKSSVNSVQEACTKCFVIHTLKFEILQITWKKWKKEHQNLSFEFFTNRFSNLAIWCFVFSCGLPTRFQFQ